MRNNKMYEANDKLVTVIRDNYDILQSLGSFGINLGFGDKTINEVCRSENVDTYTFLAVVNFTINGYRDADDATKVSIPTLLHYLKASHEFFLGYQLPFIRRELTEALDANDHLARLILKLFDEYSRSITKHMQYEEKTVFPYVDSLLNSKIIPSLETETYSQHHLPLDKKLNDLKNIIIKYLPSDGLHNNQLTSTLYDIHNFESLLDQHAQVEEQIFLPSIRHLENKLRQSDVTQKISNMVSASDNSDALSEREKDVVISIVQGMTNKEIADHLFISVNTVITHRRNIARKLQIHSPAGLTIYAIVNNLVDITNVQL